jgi:hypothetical protein
MNLVSYRRMVVGTLLHATVHLFLYNFLNVLVQIANKMGLQKKYHNIDEVTAVVSFCTSNTSEVT